MEWTGAQLREARDQLRTRAERLLGRLLFDYAQLETALDLCLAWVDEGRNFDKRSKELERIGFCRKLELLEADARCRAAEHCYPTYMDWVKRSHALRERRNTLVHGRIGFDATRGVVVVVSSRVTSTTVISDNYSLAELEQIVGEVGRLTLELRILRSTYPL